MTEALKELVGATAKKRKVSESDAEPDALRRLYLVMLQCGLCGTLQLYSVDEAELTPDHKNDVAECLLEAGDDGDPWTVDLDAYSHADIRLAYSMNHECTRASASRNLIEQAFDGREQYETIIKTLTWTSRGELFLAGYDVIQPVSVVLPSDWLDDEEEGDEEENDEAEEEREDSDSSDE